MHGCLEQLNQLLHVIRSSLVQLSSLLTGHYDVISDKHTQLLHSLLANRVPYCWQYCPLQLPATIELTCYLDILQRMVTCMTQYFQQPTGQIIDITYVPNINGLLQEFMLFYCITNNVQVEDVYLSCQVSSYIMVMIIVSSLHQQLLEEVTSEQDDDGSSLILTANRLSIITGHDQSTPIAAIKVTAMSSTDHLITCPLILAYGQWHAVQVTLAVNYSKTINSLMYTIQ